MHCAVGKTYCRMHIAYKIMCIYVWLSAAHDYANKPVLYYNVVCSCNV